MKKTHRIYLSLGTNIGEREKNLEKGIRLLQERVGKLAAESSWYQTKAWGVREQPDFLNMVVEMQTSLSPQLTLETILAIETAMGRVRERKWYTRLIDIDLLFYEDLIIKEPHLMVPHPYLQARNFVLQPLMEIAPLWIHPVLKKSIRELVLACADTLAAEKIVK